jgi:hypothetical protein
MYTTDYINILLIYKKIYNDNCDNDDDDFSNSYTKACSQIAVQDIKQHRRS